MSKENDLDKTMVLAPSMMGKYGQEVPQARLVCTNESELKGPGGREILLESSEVTLGRGAHNSIVINAAGVSQSHARIFPAGDMWGIADLGSTNGVIVNDAQVHETWLKHEDTITLGKVHYRYEEIEEHTMALGASSLSFERDGEGAETLSMSNVDGADITSPEEDGHSPQVAKETAVEQEPIAATLKSTKPLTPAKPAERSNLGLWLFTLGAILLGLVVVRTLFFG